MDYDYGDFYDDFPMRWKTFHNTTREYVIFLLLFAFLYTASYCFICQFRKKFTIYPDCYEDAFANRISLWFSSFSLGVSIGAALLLPISIISNEILLRYPNSYYVQWLNSSLIQGLWNLVFLFSNASLFLFLPFSHFILESEGFPGSSKGIMARVYESLLVLALIGLVIMGTIYIVSAIFDGGPLLHSAFSIPSHYLPFLYSCVSFVGVLMLLICTPVGFARLFSVMSDLLMKRKYAEERAYFLENVSSSEQNASSSQGPEVVLNPSPEGDASHVLFRSTDLYHRKMYSNDAYSFNDSDLESMLKYDWDIEGEGRSKFSISSLRRNCIYPIVMLVLVSLTIVSLLMVSHNTLELCIGLKSLPQYSQNLTLGISSLSALGSVGATLEIIMILYLWCTSVVGLYSLPLFCRLRPRRHNTSLSEVVGNCAVLLVMSCALPVLARSLGITNFDLLGYFGRINWLGNFYIVLIHNFVFLTTVAICLLTKMTRSVRNEMYERLCSPLRGSPFRWILNRIRS